MPARPAVVLFDLDGVIRHYDPAVAARAKPEPEIFAAAAGAFGVAPSACFFVDDLEPNIIGARAAGMDAERHTDAAALRAALHARGLPV